MNSAAYCRVSYCGLGMHKFRMRDGHISTDAIPIVSNGSPNSLQIIMNAHYLPSLILSSTVIGSTRLLQSHCQQKYLLLPSQHYQNSSTNQLH